MSNTIGEIYGLSPLLGPLTTTTPLSFSLFGAAMTEAFKEAFNSTQKMKCYFKYLRRPMLLRS